MYIYKIYNPTTELYSKGGLDPGWSKHGKVWNTAGHLKQHLSLRGKPYPPGCIILQYKINTPELIKQYPVQQDFDTPPPANNHERSILEQLYKGL